MSLNMVCYMAFLQFKKPLGRNLEYGIAKCIIFELTILGDLRNIHPKDFFKNKWSSCTTNLNNSLIRELAIWLPPIYEISNLVQINYFWTAWCGYNFHFSREFKQTLLFIWQIGSQYGGNVMTSVITVSYMNPYDLTVFTQRNLFEQRMCKYGGYLNILFITAGHMASCNWWNLYFEVYILVELYYFWDGWLG